MTSQASDSDGLGDHQVFAGCLTLSVCVDIVTWIERATMNKRDKAKWQRYEMQAEVIGALAHPIRIAIADLLKDGEVCVCEIAERIQTERSNTSRHLAIMLKAGILKTRKDGLQVFYSLRTPCILNVLTCTTQTLQQNVTEQVKALAAK